LETIIDLMKKSLLIKNYNKMKRSESYDKVNPKFKIKHRSREIVISSDHPDEENELLDIYK
jgi:hypothetical protein